VLQFKNTQRKTVNRRWAAAFSYTTLKKYQYLSICILKKMLYLCSVLIIQYGDVQKSDNTLGAGIGLWLRGTGSGDRWRQSY
jgi:hypothetical protein